VEMCILHFVCVFSQLSSDNIMEKSFTSTKVEKENVKKLMDAIYLFIHHALQPSKDFVSIRPLSGSISKAN
jgi:hypothetical protein